MVRGDVMGLYRDVDIVDIDIKDLLGKKIRVYGKIFRFQRLPYEYEIEIIRTNFYRLRIGSYEYYIDWEEGKVVINEKVIDSKTITRKGQNNQIIKLLTNYFRKVKKTNKLVYIEYNKNNGNNRKLNIDPTLQKLKKVFDTLFIFAPIVLSHYVNDSNTNDNINNGYSNININQKVFFQPKSKEYLNARKKLLKYFYKTIPKNLDNKEIINNIFNKFFPIYKFIEIINTTTS